MKSAKILPKFLPKFLPAALCLALGACAAPTGPTVFAVAPEGGTDKRLASDAAACRARTQTVVDAQAANGELNLQGHYNSLYAECMSGKGYHIDVPPPRPVVYNAGPYYYGPGPYWGVGPVWGGGFYYGGGWGPRW